jgi:hypothetical protein
VVPPREAPQQDISEENARLAARVRELEHLLELERSRSEGLARGIDALSAQLSALHRQEPTATAGAH